MNSYQLELENLSEAIRGEAEPLLGRADAVGNARALEALYASAEIALALDREGDVHRRITDNNAKLFKQGYDSVLNPLYANGTLVKAKAGDQLTDWDPIKGRQIFDQMLARNNNDMKGSIAANDGLAGAVIASLKAHGEKPIPLTGQDAPDGRQFILAALLEPS